MRLKALRLSDEQIGRPAITGAHTLGALVVHIGEADGMDADGRFGPQTN